MTGITAMMAAAGAQPRISLAATYSVSDSDPSSASASLSLENDGDIVGVGDSGGGDRGDWISPKLAASSAYEVRLTVTSGSFAGSATGSWLDLGTTRTWTVARASAGTSTATGTLEIRRASDGVVLASTNAGGVSLTAEVG